MTKVGAAARAHPDDRARRAALLRWYGRNRRDLPWRRARDPYAIWVSEIMLQQTRVETVVPYYERFLERFPTLHALARSSESSVLAAWSGLGYYRRARNLRDAASLVARDHGGAIPRDPAALRALPGIGAYTAAAIASIAFDRPAAAVDGNVVRVIARWDGRRGRRDDAALRRAVTARAESLAPGARPGDWTQALMELGATLCLPRDPLCERCPVARWCRARRGGRPDRYP
ncbi:MAG TPA: A/G-specific adenine glycosylase, partial [Candidatus Eisenbacteria bacterium]|nr:A/G-specific adenine glycosylase [Candidatus Eisenbacteria bacterium]